METWDYGATVGGHPDDSIDSASSVDGEAFDSVELAVVTPLSWFLLATSSKMLSTRSAQRKWHEHQRSRRLQADVEFLHLQGGVCETQVLSRRSRRVKSRAFSVCVNQHPAPSRTVLTRNVHTRRLRRFCPTSAPFSAAACARRLQACDLSCPVGDALRERDVRKCSFTRRLCHICLHRHCR